SSPRAFSSGLAQNLLNQVSEVAKVEVVLDWKCLILSLRYFQASKRPAVCVRTRENFELRTKILQLGLVRIRS
ncbi:MAG: hypothetical protein JWO71_3711, partial [Candidatus Acidoferrum typicum]|nr:hypothetical protein [Candidatus Acidoferrum typicum]